MKKMVIAFCIAIILLSGCVQPSLDNVKPTILLDSDASLDQVLEVCAQSNEELFEGGRIQGRQDMVDRIATTLQTLGYLSLTLNDANGLPFIVNLVPVNQT